MPAPTHSRHIGLLGGTGFVGRALCQRLRADGHRLTLLTRDASANHDLAQDQQLRLIEGDIESFEFMAEQLTGCDVAINLVGILNERGHSGREFRALHAELPRSFARACRKAGVSRVLHMSALGAQAGSAPSRYLRSKGEGANALQLELGAHVDWTIFCPSVIFGPGDSFTNRFAGLLKIMPGFFPLACPDTRFAPVYVGDVVAAFAVAIDHTQSSATRYQLCGPNEYSLREIVNYLGQVSGHPRRILGLPDPLARMQAAVMEYLPGKPFSRDNYLSLQIDSTCSAHDSEPGFAALGITPVAMEQIVPGYLAPDSAR